MPTASFFNGLKNERVHVARYKTRAQAEAGMFKYIAVFYNRRRRHFTLGYRSPIQFGQRARVSARQRGIGAAAWEANLGGPQCAIADRSRVRRA